MRLERQSSAEVATIRTNRWQHRRCIALTGRNSRRRTILRAVVCTSMIWPMPSIRRGRRAEYAIRAVDTSRMRSRQDGIPSATPSDSFSRVANSTEEEGSKADPSARVENDRSSRPSTEYLALRVHACYSCYAADCSSNNKVYPIPFPVTVGDGNSDAAMRDRPVTLDCYRAVVQTCLPEGC